MAPIKNLSPQDRTALEREVQVSARGLTTLESAAQRYVELFHAKFREDVALARVFVTVPYAKLPQANRAFVDALSEKAGIADRIRHDTLVLSLVGTAGADPTWSDRRKSQGHVGIPLATSDFVDAIPMMSRLLKELGVDLDWIDSGDTSIIARSLGASAGVFFVRDAKTETDVKGRKVIPAQEFVDRCGVKTVFGLGGAYMGTDACLVNIVFCRAELDRANAVDLLGLINRFKVSTVELAKTGRIFQD